MDVRIGVTYTSKELEIDLGDEADKDAVQKQITEALGETNGVLWLTDRKGRSVGVPSAKIAYIEIGASKEERRVGFVG